jgi:drug/metabolite transporter (DMT)-like permease
VKSEVVQRKAALDSVGVVCLIACCALWGLNQVAAKLALAEVPPLTQAAVRSLGALALVFGWSAWRRVPMLRRDGTAPAGVLAGVLFAGEFACIFIGLQFTSASRMAVFLYLAPFVVALGMPFIARAERLSPLQLAGLVAAFAGVAFALTEGFSEPSAGPRQWLGDALGVLAAVLWGATTLAVRATALGNAAAEKTLFYQLAVSGLLLAAAVPLFGEPLPTRISPMVIGLLLFQTVIVTFASYLLWFWLVRHYPATRLSSFTLLTPVFGLLAGALLLGEPVTPRLMIALAAVSAGIYIVNQKRAR